MALRPRRRHFGWTALRPDIRAIRLSISHNLPVDDIKSNVYTQTLELGYIAKQPPLYEWLLWLV